jgi:hypothetical protein
MSIKDVIGITYITDVICITEVKDATFTSEIINITDIIIISQFKMSYVAGRYATDIKDITHVKDVIFKTVIINNRHDIHHTCKSVVSIEDVVCTYKTYITEVEDVTIITNIALQTLYLSLTAKCHEHQ